MEVEGKWGYIDKRGAFVIPPKFNGAGAFSEGLAPAQAMSGNWGFINQQGRFVVNPRFQAACGFSEDLACIKRRGQWGYIDRDGKIVVQPRFQLPVGDFSEGLAVVTVDDKYAFIDKTGKVIISPRFELAYSFSHGLAVASANRKTGFINRLGMWAFPPYSGEPDFLSEGFVAVVDQKDGEPGEEWGYMGLDGKFIWRAPVVDAPTQEMWPFVDFDETQKQKEIEKSCQ